MKVEFTLADHCQTIKISGEDNAERALVNALDRCLRASCNPDLTTMLDAGDGDMAMSQKRPHETEGLNDQQRTDVAVMIQHGLRALIP
tara:strand:+ start:850 stop:1113 length:264 start_codon:yes stop_codon:yes gene_type:complete